MVIGLEQKIVEQFAAQQPAELVNFFQPITEIVSPAMGTISAIVGGLFGLYLIFIVVRLYYERKKVRLLRNINYDLDYLNQHFKLPYSMEKETPNKIMSLEKLQRIVAEKEQRKKEKLKKKEAKIKKKGLKNKKYFSIF